MIRNAIVNACIKYTVQEHERTGQFILPKSVIIHAKYERELKTEISTGIYLSGHHVRIQFSELVDENRIIVIKGDQWKEPIMPDLDVLSETINQCLKSVSDNSISDTTKEHRSTTDEESTE